MKNFLYSLFVGLFGITGLTSIAFLLMYAAQSKQQAHLYSDLAAVRKQDTQQEIASQSSVQPTSRNLYLENSDMVGWIQIEGTRIDYPVMQTPADPNYYLKHDFEKHYTDYGCPFMQADCDALCPSDNLIIYGHNMKTGTIFGCLTEYRKADYYQEHPFIEFDTVYGDAKYEVFGAFTIDVVNDTSFVYNQYIDMDEDAYNRYVDQVISRSDVDSGIRPAYGEQLLTLSTCEYSSANGRYVVVARRVSD